MKKCWTFYWKTGFTENSYMKSILLFIAYSTFEQENGIIFQEDFEAASVQKMISK